MDAVRIARVNVLHSIIIAGISYWEFRDTIQASPEIYFSMFLALIGLTFSNNIRSGNVALTNAALLICIIILCLQLYFSIEVFQAQFLLDKLRKIVMIVSGAFTFILFMIYLRKS